MGLSILQDLKEESSAFAYCCCLLQISLKSSCDGISEKVVSAIYAFLDMHTLLANYGLFCLAVMLQSCIVIVELGNFHPSPLQLPVLDMPAGGVTQMSVCADLHFVNLPFKYWFSKCNKLYFSSHVIF